MKFQEVHPLVAEADTSADRWLARGVTALKALLVLMVFVGILFGFRVPLEEQNAVRRHVDALREDGVVLKAERDALLRQLSWIETDIGYLEVEARDRFNLAKSGEFVIRFQD
ncbi:MAG: septum formation initiator family protein [Verrucomicrobiales bacterium]|nr:septum formation initiator family protein [Verrucomicrobiales bacterium]